MAGKTTRKTTGRKKTASTRTTAAQRQAKKQMWAVVLFAAGILLGALTFIKGENLWTHLHSFLFGLFGWSSYFLSPILIYIAVIAALDKPLSSPKAKLWETITLIVLISGTIQVFGAGMPQEGNLAANIALLYQSGVELSGGGLSGAVFGLPLLGLFGKTGAAIVLILSMFVFVMLITGSTLIGLFHSAAKPVKTIEDAYAAKMEERPAAPASAPAAPASSARFDIDVPVADDLPAHPVQTPKPEKAASAKDKLLAAAGVDSPVEYVSADEFAPPALTPPASKEEPTPPEEPHPLDEDIEAATSPESGEIADIVSRFMMTLPTEEANTAAPDAALPWDEPVAFEPLPTEALPFEAAAVEPQAEPLPQPPTPPLPRSYISPSITLLKEAKAPAAENITDELKNNAQTLVDTLKSFGVQTRITDICRGPAVTRYELQPSAGVKISKITGLADDIALNLAASGIRIEAPIPNKPAVGIEIPNKTVSIVSIREILDSKEFREAKGNLSVALGKDIAGNIAVADIAKMPHVLIAGATGSGKSVCINSIIMSILYKASPDEVKLLMVDPKVVELGVYNGIPHLLVPVVTDPKKAAGALGWAVTEMLNRYKTFAENSVRDLAGYNRLAKDHDELPLMPQIVIIIDELADLMMAAPNEVEDSICRLAQMARAAGMHLVIATQRPSVDVITGVIKANIPSRVAFAVSSQVDSRTILDMGGAEKLLGRGDMLFYPVGAAKPVRVQGCFVTDTEVEKVVTFIKESQDTDYDQAIADEIDRHAVAEKGASKDGGGFDDEDEMLPAAIECVVEAGQASTSLLQRRLKLGYARAARIVDQMEDRGIVGPFEGSKPRQVLISKDRWIEMKLQGAEENLMSASR